MFTLPYCDTYFTKSIIISQLKRLSIIGCPTPGFYGYNCSLPCPQNCQEGHCDIENGTCLGCIPGYKGPECDQSMNIVLLSFFFFRKLLFCTLIALH